MFPVLMANLVQYFFGIIMFLLAVFLMLLVLVQRGRGGGLAGALGGMGGQSAFGTKAGDTFTRVTIVTAFIWIVFCIIAVRVLSTQSSKLPGPAPAGVSPQIPLGGSLPDASMGATGTGAGSTDSGATGTSGTSGTSGDSGTGSGATDGKD